MEMWQYQSIFAQNIAKLILFIHEQNNYCTFGEAYRTIEQAEIYAKRGIGIKNSLHSSRLAMDLNLFSSDGHYESKAEAYKPYADYWLTLDPANRAGYYFPNKDANHFEMHIKP